MALPNTNISVAMVRSELGAATNNVGQLCIHPNINIWSKWKPVSMNINQGELTEQKLKDRNYGIYVVNKKKPLDLLNVVIHGEPVPEGEPQKVTHEYLAPRGGYTEVYRLGDFRNYVHSGGSLPTTTGRPAISYHDILNNPVIPYGTSVTNPVGVISKGDIYPSNALYRGILIMPHASEGSSGWWTTGQVDWTNVSLSSFRGDIRFFEFYTNIAQPTLISTVATPNPEAVFYAVMSSEKEANSSNPYVLHITSEGAAAFRYTIALTAYWLDEISLEYTLEFSAVEPHTTGGQLTGIDVRIFVNDVDINHNSTHPDYNLPNNSTKYFSSGFAEEQLPNMKLKVFENGAERISINI